MRHSDAGDSRVRIPTDGPQARRMRLLARGLYELARVRRKPRSAGEVRTVVHLSPSLFGADGITGGGERAAYELAQSIATHLPTTLVSFGNARRSWREGDLAMEIYPSAGDLGGQTFDPLCLRFLEQLRKADVIHCNQYRVAVSQLAILAGAAMGKRTYVTDRGGVGLHFDPHLAVQSRLTALLPISSFSLSQLPVGVPTHVILGGATEFFLRGGAHRAQDSPSTGRRVLYVGRVMRHKGIDVLIEGLPQGIGLDVVGRVYDEQYADLLHRLAVGRDVRFVHDATDDWLLDAYRGALVTVLPSVYRDAFGGNWRMPELLGNVLLESMSCATPVICTDVGGMPEVVDHTVTGFVVAPNDPLALRARIEEFARDPRLRDDMGRRARERVLERFTWARVAERTLAAYRGDQPPPG